MYKALETENLHICPSMKINHKPFEFGTQSNSNRCYLEIYLIDQLNKLVSQDNRFKKY